MTQQEFYALPEVQQALEIQKANPFGSPEHRRAHKLILQIGKAKNLPAEAVKSLETYE